MPAPPPPAGAGNGHAGGAASSGPPRPSPSVSAPAAPHADRALCRADGRPAGELHDPTQQDLLDALALAADSGA